ncbi:MAG: hypothetical protein R2818_01940 [Flavobacteriales bacterium]
MAYAAEHRIITGIGMHAPAPWLLAVQDVGALSTEVDGSFHMDK